MNVLLFVDRCTAHINVNWKKCSNWILSWQLHKPSTNVWCIFVQSFQFFYIQQFFHNTLLYIDSWSLGDAFKKNVNSLETLHLIFSAWKNVTKRWIANCYAKAWFAKFSKDDNEHMGNYVVNLIDYGFIEYASIDKDIITSGNEALTISYFMNMILMIVTTTVRDFTDCIIIHWIFKWSKNCENISLKTWISSTSF